MHANFEGAAQRGRTEGAACEKRGSARNWHHSVPYCAILCHTVPKGSTAMLLHSIAADDGKSHSAEGPHTMPWLQVKTRNLESSHPVRHRYTPDD
eukprot:scaffold222925_cov30-Tisochrysis_lutea.AAC.1